MSLLILSALSGCAILVDLEGDDDDHTDDSGVVDTDSYTAEIHLPFFATDKEGVYVIEKGTPLAQVIPFRRDASALSMYAHIVAETPEDADRRERTHRSVISDEGWYRTQARAPR